MTDPYADDAERARRMGRGFARFTERWRGWIDRRPWLRGPYKVLVTIIGVLVILAGVIMLVTPGPGWLAIFFGLAILGTEYHWARRLLGWLRQKLARFWERWRAWRAARRARKAGE
ncbi:MAG: TIGR02611 family protein [Leucobacter sp.]